MSDVSSTLHPPYASPRRQREAVVFGLWVFLASELLLFAGLFAAFFACRYGHEAAFAEAARHTNLIYGTANTALLFTSSLAMSVAGRSLEAQDAKLARALIWISMALGLAFLVGKGFEYKDDLDQRLWPGADFALADQGARIFWGFYWIMTALHALHLTTGVGLMGRLAWLGRRGELLSNTDAMEATSLYWHFVDMVWIVVYAILYLVGR